MKIDGSGWSKLDRVDGVEATQVVAVGRELPCQATTSSGE